MGVSTSMLSSPLPTYARHIGASNSIIGFVTGFFAFSALLCRPIFGNMLDSKGRKVVLIFGIIAYCVIVLSYGWVSTIVVLLVLRLLHGIGFSAYSTASGTVAADLIPAERLVEGLGCYGVFQTAAMAIGPMLGFWLIANFSYSSLFYVSFALGFVGLCLAFFLNYEKKADKQPSLQQNQAVVKQKGVMLEKTAIPTASVVFFITLTMGAVITFLPAYALSRGIKSIGIYFMVNAVVVLLTRTLIGRATSRHGISKVIFCGMLLSAASMILLAFSVSIYGFIISGVLNGLGAGVVFPIMNSLLIRFCPKERRGAANATYYSAFDIGIGAGAVIGGIISQAAGYSALYIVSAFCIVLSFTVYFFTVRRRLQLEAAS